MSARWINLAGIGSVAAPVSMRAIMSSVPAEALAALPTGAMVATITVVGVLFCVFLVSLVVSAVCLIGGGEVV